jgi:CheY-like chemotaxis protein
MIEALVVEDDAISRKLLTDVLSANGYAVQATGRGEDAPALALARPPDVALLDIHLPGIDGVETLRRLRALPGLAGLPAIAVTASVMLADHGRVLEAGFDLLLHKPVRLQPLLQALRTVLKTAPPRPPGEGPPDVGSTGDPA